MVSGSRAAWELTGTTMKFLINLARVKEVRDTAPRGGADRTEASATFCCPLEWAI